MRRVYHSRLAPSMPNTKAQQQSLSAGEKRQPVAMFCGQAEGAYTTSAVLTFSLAFKVVENIPSSSFRIDPSTTAVFSCGSRKRQPGQGYRTFERQAISGGL